ncbi:MAG TPA: hypothetical protein VK874_17395 [Gaiellaceae bacterium]|nr:hypothetical protein [Gaiellaceae bacterium]
MDPAASGSVGRGETLLLEHLDAARRLTDAPRRSAEDRLAAELGGDFAWRLVRALAGERPMRVTPLWAPSVVVA